MASPALNISIGTFPTTSVSSVTLLVATNASCPILTLPMAASQVPVLQPCLIAMTTASVSVNLLFLSMLTFHKGAQLFIRCRRALFPSSSQKVFYCNKPEADIEVKKQCSHILHIPRPGFLHLY